jgi:hypothetical protein
MVEPGNSNGCLKVISVMAAIDSAPAAEKPTSFRAGIHCWGGMCRASTGFLNAAEKAAATSAGE